MKIYKFLICFFLFSCSSKNFLKIKNPDSDNIFKAVIEIPAGTTAKWEVMPGGKLEWDKKNGKNRIVDYIGYPANYGIIPGYMAGDGDPMDVFVLGDSLARGTIVKINLIGVMKATDKGENDDKYIAVIHESELDQLTKSTTGLHKVKSLNELRKQYPGILSIIKIFTINYKQKKGKSPFKINGFEEFRSVGQ